MTPEEFEKFKIVLKTNKEKTGNTLLGIGKERGDESDAQLRFILGNKKLSGEIKTRVGNVLSVLEQTKALAKANPEGKFKGLGKFLRVPPELRSKKVYDEVVQNRQMIESINLLSQVWASGAALTEAQTAQVKRMTPDKNDTDRQVRAKINGLISLMYTDVNGKLKAEGIFMFKPKQTDMFASRINLQDINLKF